MVLDIIKRQTESQAREGKCGWVKDGNHTCFFPREAIPEYTFGRMIIKFRQNGTLNNVNWPGFFVNFTHLLGYLQNQALKGLQKFELCKMSIIIYILVDCQLLRAVLKISSLKQNNIQHSSQSCYIFLMQSFPKWVLWKVPFPVSPFLLLVEFYCKDIWYGTIVCVECFFLVWFFQ